MGISIDGVVTLLVKFMLKTIFTVSKSNFNTFQIQIQTETQIQIQVEERALEALQGAPLTPMELLRRAEAGLHEVADSARAGAGDSAAFALRENRWETRRAPTPRPPVVAEVGDQPI